MSYWVELLGTQQRYTGKKYRTRIIEFGEGPPLILLHGNGGYAENFVKNIRAYGEHFRTIAMDLLWHGFSSKPQFDPELIPCFVDQILDVMDAEGIEKAHFEGQSMGGWPAMTMALRHRDRVGKLILTTTQGFQLETDTGGEKNTALLQQLKEQSLHILQNPTWENIRTRLERLVVNKQLIDEESIALRHRIYNDQQTNEALQRVNQAYFGGAEIGKHMIREEDLRRISCPSLVYWGDQNPVPPSVGRKLARIIPNAQFHSAKKTGHWAQFENASEHNEQVIRFLTSC